MFAPSLPRLCTCGRRSSPSTLSHSMGRTSIRALRRLVWKFRSLPICTARAASCTSGVPRLHRDHVSRLCMLPPMDRGSIEGRTTSRWIVLLMRPPLRWRTGGNPSSTSHATVASFLRVFPPQNHRRCPSTDEQTRPRPLVPPVGIPTVPGGFDGGVSVVGSGPELAVQARVGVTWQEGVQCRITPAVYNPRNAATRAMSRMASPASSSAREERMRRAAMAARATCPKVAHNPKDAEAWKALGDAAESLGLVDEAKVAFRKARELDPGFLRVPPAPGDNQPASHEVEKARRAVTAIVMRHGRRSKISPEDEEKLQAQGNAFFKARKYEDAVMAYSRAISFCPELASLYGNRSAAYYMLKKFKEAAVDAVKACKVDPFYVKGYSRAAKAYLCLGDVEQAKAQLMQARAKGADVEQDLRSISIVEKAKTINGNTLTRENMRLIEKAMEIAPNVEQFKVAMGRVLLTRGKHQEALALCRGLKVDGSKHASEILSIRAEASYLIGDTKAAERYFAQALASDPKNLHAKRFMDTVQAVQNNKQKGNQAFQIGRWEEAYQHYTAAMNVDPNVRNSLVAQCACNRAAVLIKLENLEDALVDCTYAIELDESYTKAYLRRAHIHSELENFEDALRDFEKVQELDPQSPDIRKLVKEAANNVRKYKYVDFYHLLEVRRTATDVEIRKAYKKACLKYHPDKNAHRTPKEKRDANRKFKHLQDAYNILLDVQKRALYDRGFSAEDIDSGVADASDDFGDMNMGNGSGDRYGSTGYSSDRRRYTNRG